MFRSSTFCAFPFVMLACMLVPSELWAAQQRVAEEFDRTKAMNEILVAMTEVAEANAKAARPLKGDALTEKLVQTAADKAALAPETVQADIFLTTVSIALDDSDALFKIPFLGDLNRRRVERFESNELRRRRFAVVSQATMRDRRDLCQHFMVSISLCQFQGAAAAKAAGIAKEQIDARGESGFSFVDLQADLAGIEFWRRVRSGDLKVSTLAKEFRIADVLPKDEGLKEGLSSAELIEQLGPKPGEALEREIKRLESRVQDLYGAEETQKD